MGYIAGIGGANMDIHGRSDQALLLHDSNPGTLHMSLGGVCRNICENLVRLGEDVRLVTVVGNDANGRSIVEGCRNAGINVDYVKMMEGERSSSYISLIDKTGDMLIAMSDMHIIKRLDDRLVDGAHTLLCQADLVICDGNLSSSSLNRLTTICDRPLYMDPVSTAWARELRPYIGYFDTVKPNRMELSALTGFPCESREEIELACDVLRGKGVHRVFVSLGQNGMLYRGPEGSLWGRSRELKRMENATGAGDASMAGIIWATRRGWDAHGILQAAMAAGIAAVLSPDTISAEMSEEYLMKLIKEYVQ